MITILSACRSSSHSLNSIQLRRLSALQSFKTQLSEQLDGIKAAGTFKNERVIVTRQGSHIKVAGNDAKILNFCANNYLGLSVNYLILKNQI